MNDQELIALLFTEEDCLPRAAVDECVGRADRFVEPLADIVRREELWSEEGSEGWAPLHAVFILGAIGTEETVDPLLQALLFVTRYGYDWVSKDLPSIFSQVGLAALKGLKKIALDRNLDWYPRIVASQGLAAVTIEYPEVEDKVFALIGSIFRDSGEDWDVRRHVGNILLDFQRKEYKDLLLDVGRGETPKEGAFYPPFAFDEKDVEKVFAKEEKSLEDYRKDWLDFYDPEQIRQRQEWRKKDARAMKKGAERGTERVVYSGGCRPYVRETPKVGRNDPCPCGSGKKYKKCCGR